MAEPTERAVPGPRTAAPAAAVRRPALIKTIGIERAPQKDLYHFVLARSWPTFFALVAGTFMAANLFFAWAYLFEPGRPSRPSATAACIR